MFQRVKSNYAVLVEETLMNETNAQQPVSDTQAERARNAFWISIGVVGAAIVGMLFYLYLAVQTRAWQHFALVGITAALFAVALLSARLSRGGRPRLGIWILIVVGVVSVGVSPLLTANQGVLYAAGIMMSTLIIGTLTMPSEQIGRVNLVGVLGGMVALLVDRFVPFFQLQPTQALLYFIPAVVIFLGLVYAFILWRFFGSFILRMKLMIAIFGTALLSVTALAVVNNITTRQALTSAANQTLRLAALQTAANIDNYLLSLMNTIGADAQAPALSIYMNLSEEERRERYEARTYLDGLLTRRGALVYVLFDRGGRVLLHTGLEETTSIPTYLGLDQLETDKILASLETDLSYISPVLFPEEGNPFFYIGKRIARVNQDGIVEPQGMLVASYALDELQKILVESNELAGEGSFAVLLDENFMRLAHGLHPEERFKLVSPLEAEKVERLQANGRLPDFSQEKLASGYALFREELEDMSTSPFFTAQEAGTGGELGSGAGVKLEHHSWILVFMQPQPVFLTPIQQQSQATVLLTVLVAAIAVVIAAFLGRLLTEPITRLTATAQQVAGGDLSIRALVESEDEIGTLARTFNTMTAELHQTLNELEQRVEERTTALARTSEQMAYRASRLQMVADVAQSIAAVQDPDELLRLVTKTISDRFGFYHVGVFLMESEYAVLRAANSPGGQRMLARGHRLKVGEVGIVGFVTGSGRARIALDVGKDAVYFDNPDLPETRSEIALPLKVGERIIGAIDVQSTEAEAFTEDDTALLSTLANQVAMAIENARLFSEIRRTLTELQIAQRQYLQQEWGRLVSERQQGGFQYVGGTVDPIPVLLEPGIWDTVADGRVIIQAVTSDGDEHPGEKSSGLLVPITLRGEVIGLIDLKDTDPTRQWSDEEITLVKSIADQVGLALENARLLEVTMRRAERERVVSEITTKLRASTDPQAILQTAINELRQVLGAKKVQLRIQPEDQSVEVPESGTDSMINDEN